MDGSTYFRGKTLSILKETHADFYVVLLGPRPSPPPDLTHRQWLTPSLSSKGEVDVEPNLTTSKKLDIPFSIILLTWFLIAS
jgi:hypothetical protein